MSRRILGRRGLADLSDSLSDRDRQIVQAVDCFRFLTTRQIEQLFFAGHGSAIASTRAARRTLERLTEERVLHRLDRRIGGLRAGSASFVYGLGPVGDRLLGVEGPRRRWREPTATFLMHTLAIAQIVVDLHLAQKSGGIELLSVETEPNCWRRFTGGMGAPETLRPDLFLALGVGDFEDRWFIEIDLATESSPAVLRKCRTYAAYHRTGSEQHRFEVFPKVLWITPHERRARLLRAAIGRDRQLPVELFLVTTTHEALALLGASPTAKRPDSDGGEIARGGAA